VSDEINAKEIESANLELWETHAKWWQDNFSEGADPEYEEQILPLIQAWSQGFTKILDVGTGEGQIIRKLTASGQDVPVLGVGIDPSMAQVAEAKKRLNSGMFLRAIASEMPFADESFDLVVACLVFEHVLEVDSAIREVARVLKRGGRFIFLLNHPLLQTPNSGWIDDHILMEQYWRIGDYLKEDVTVEEVQKDVFIPFVHRPLSRYVNLLVQSGLYIEEMLEPPPPPGFIAQAWEYQQAAFIPRLLALRTSKR
jgi:SAM-dependent methyltransferase